MSATVAIRDGRAEDWRYVCDTFARDYIKTAHGRPLGKDGAKKAIAALLEAWTLTVAAPLTGGDEIYAWALHRGPAEVAWVYVKPTYRGIGFAVAVCAGLADGGTVNVPFWPGDRYSPRRLDRRRVSLRHRPHLILEALLGRK